jgi:hypothetical protein
MKLLIKEVRDTGNQDAHDNHIFRVDGKTEGGEEFSDAYVAVKQKANAPAQGLSEKWELSKSDQGYRLKRASTDGPRGGGGGGGKGWQPRIEDDPAVYAGKQASIAMQHSQSVAAAVVALAAQGGGSDELHERVKVYAADYFEQVQGAARAAAQRQRGD